jgi:hypothetical protein
VNSPIVIAAPGCDAIAMATRTDLDDVERAICEAIWGHRVIAFSLKGYERIAEPHDFG